MEKFNYKEICSDLLSGLNGKQKEVVLRRFGLRKSKKETLEAIGRDFNVCRERVRQIQSSAVERIRKNVEKHENVFSFFSKHFKSFGGLRKESSLLEEFGGPEFKNEVSFLLSLDDSFSKINATSDFHALWTAGKDSFESAKKAISLAHGQLKKARKSLPVSKLKAGIKGKALASALDVSKKIEKSREGLYGLSTWPEINPKGIKDKAYLVLRKSNKPLHFREVTKLIEDAHVQTVHNELIKDPRFVLVGRGTYALAEWGYYPGQVKDVIISVLNESREPMHRDEILEKVLKQRMVKENTVLLNLSDRNRFRRDSDGKYTVKEI